MQHFEPDFPKEHERCKVCEAWKNGTSHPNFDCNGLIIVISNNDAIVCAPWVYVIRDGKATGSSVTLGYDKSHERGLMVAQNLLATFPDAKIWDAWRS